MTLNPYRKYRVFTELSTDQVILNIQESIGSRDFLKLGGSPSNLLEGKTTNTSFKIKKKFDLSQSIGSNCNGKTIKT